MILFKLFRQAAKAYNSVSLILRIVVGIVVGTALALLVPGAAWVTTVGSLFVGALKAVAPVLVFVLVSGALAQGVGRLDKRFGLVLALYLMSTFLAAALAVVMSFLFPQTLVLAAAAESETVPQGIVEVLRNLLMNLVANPFQSLAGANYIGILFWAVLFGLAMKAHADDNGKRFMTSVADAVSNIVRWVINLAPFGIMGLVYDSVSTSGMDAFTVYGKLLLLLVSTMLLSALVIAPLLTAVFLRRNPYPLTLRCLRESGITAFFTRSSAANIPVNMSLCSRMGLDKDMYSISIPLGATINMNGAAITITIMTLAAASTLGLQVDFATAIVLSVLATLGACGASGVAGGSLLLIPMACSLFGISNDVAMQVVGVGFIIGVVQDSLETMLNSSSDVQFTATAEFYSWQREGKPLPAFMYSKAERERLGLAPEKK